MSNDEPDQLTVLVNLTRAARALLEAKGPVIDDDLVEWLTLIETVQDAEGVEAVWIALNPPSRQDTGDTGAARRAA